nr:undecaprenyl-phosphate galactose phosphotransferase WbaP [Kosakonia oryziphila]
MSNYSMMSIKNSHRELKCNVILICSDLVALFSSFFISCFFLTFAEGGLNRFIPAAYFSTRFHTLALLYAFFIFWFSIRLRHYTSRKPFWSELKEILRTIVIFSIFDLALVAITKWEVSRYSFGSTWLLAFLLVPCLRFLTKTILLRLKYWQRPTLIIGSSDNAYLAYCAVKREKYLGLEVKGFLVTDKSYLSNLVDPDLLFTEKELQLRDLAKDNYQVIIALEYNEQNECDHYLRLTSKPGFHYVSVIPPLRGVPLYGTELSYFFSEELMILKVGNNLGRLSSRIFKRIFDVVCAVTILAMIWPLFIILSYKIRKDGGKTFYSQVRVGRNGQKFNCYKLRSMVHNSEQVLKSLLETDPSARLEWEKDHKLKNDPRITKIGHFIRNTSLDELPQLWNVVRGEMSLVGPRPVVDEELEKYGDDVEYYLMVRPGMTGLWQVSGRNDVDYERRVYFDSWYVKNWSLWNDIVILIKTISVVVYRSGAY